MRSFARLMLPLIEQPTSGGPKSTATLIKTITAKIEAKILPRRLNSGRLP